MRIYSLGRKEKKKGTRYERRFRREAAKWLGYVDGSTGSITPTVTARALNPPKSLRSAMKINRRRASNHLCANRRWFGDGFDGRTMDR
jgi:hypothetical protein